MSRADKFTANKKTPIYYSDITPNLDRNPVTGLLARLTNEQDVRQAVFNLLMTDLGERPYQPQVGGKLRALLFEPMDDVTSALIQTVVETTLRNWEPRITLKGVIVKAHDEDNEYVVTIICSLINIPASDLTFTIPLKRVR